MSHGDRIPWGDARAIAASAGTMLPVDNVALEAAVGRVLRGAVVAAVDIPHYPSAAMDGWAAAGSGPWRLTAGDTLRAGDATRIVTGGLLPDGAATVIASEDATETDGTLTLDRAGSHSHIRPPAEEAQAGEVLVPIGTRLSPAQVALAAAAAVDRLEVAAQPRIHTVFTGDEVVLTGLPDPGQVRDSFGPTIPAILRLLGGEVVGTTRIGDDRSATIAALRDAKADIVVTTGGTGGSNADHVRRALDDLDAEFLVSGLAARPGGPTLLARLPGGALVLGLPGNPLAAMLGLLSLGEPLLAGLTGRVLPPLPTVAVPATIRRHPVATRLVPVRAGLDVVEWTGAAMMRGLAAASAVLVVPPEGDAQLLSLPWT